MKKTSAYPLLGGASHSSSEGYRKGNFESTIFIMGAYSEEPAHAGSQNRLTVGRFTSRLTHPFVAPRWDN